MNRTLTGSALLLSLGLGRTVAGPPPAIRLYVLDCGTTEHVDPTRFGLASVRVPRLADPCFLIVHPRGTLLWDAGPVADSAWTPNGTAQLLHVPLPGGATREVTVRERLSTQLDSIGVPPGRVTYVALSHAHWDHTANLYQFPGATWIVRRAEQEALAATPPLPLSRPADLDALRGARAIVIDTGDFDVFGDGAVIIKFAPGHTPGHQVLYVRLAHTGGVVLAGDLYHFPEQLTTGAVPSFDYDTAATRASRAKIEAFVKQMSAQRWIQHDFTANAGLRKAPSFYE